MRNPFRYFNSSPEVILLAVMMYIRYPLSLRQVEELLFERGIDICHETVRFWWNRFGPMFAAEIRKRRVHHSSYSRWRWHLDEVFVKINGETHYLWRAVDHEGEVLEVFATKRRDRRAARKFLKRTMKRYGRPRLIVTDRLRSYAAALRVIGISERQECGRWLNNRAENSHQPFRRRERAMAKFRSVKTLQKFASVHASIHNHFNQDRHLGRRDIFEQNRAAALADWCELMGLRNPAIGVLTPCKFSLTEPPRLMPARLSGGATSGEFGIGEVAAGPRFERTQGVTLVVSGPPIRTYLRADDQPR